jgi:hypothetical protein
MTHTVSVEIVMDDALHIGDRLSAAVGALIPEATERREGINVASRTWSLHPVSEPDSSFRGHDRPQHMRYNPPTLGRLYSRVRMSAVLTGFAIPLQHWGTV